MSMKRTILMLAAVCSAALLNSLDADARRLGGGRSVGAPRDAVTQRQAAPQQSAAPTQSVAPASAAAAAKAPSAAPAPVQAPQPAWKRWMGPIAGIAAGLGIAALMSHLGLSEGFGNFLLIALFIVAAIVVFRLLFRRSPPQQKGEGMQYAGAGLGAGGAQTLAGSSTPIPMFGGGGDGSAITNAEVLPESAAKPFPPGFEPEPFVQQAKLNFARLQAAYDKADTSMLRDVMTPEMFAEVGKDLAARATHHPTEIVTLAAEILEVTTENDFHWASVRFTGLLREDGAETAQPFDEVWNLNKPVGGETGWLLAGIQQLQ
jgi:predicted lipid-binding transport protein (Tim44 family)